MVNKSVPSWRQVVRCAVVAVALTALPRTAAAYDPSLSRWAGLCAQSQGYAPGCGTIPPSPVHEYRPEQQAIDRLQQERRQQEDEAREKRERAAVEDSNGLAAESRGDLRSAANSFITALNIDPGNATIRAHLNRITNKMQNATATAEMTRVIEAVQNQIATARMTAMTDRMRVDATTNRLTALYKRLAGAARHTPAGSSQRSANRQSQKVLSSLGKNEYTCYDVACFDLGANSDGTLVVPPAPEVTSSGSTQNETEAQAAMQRLVTDYNDIHQKLRQAQADHDPAAADLGRRDTLANAQVIMAVYTAKTRKAMNSYSVETAVQTNPGAETIEGKSIRSAPAPQPCAANGSTALGQLKTAAGGGSVGCAVENRADAVTPNATVRVPDAHAVVVLSDTELAWYNRTPAFLKANRNWVEARDSRKVAQARREELDRQIAAAPTPAAKSELVIKLSHAVVVERAAKGAEVIAENERARVVQRLPGPPIIRPRSEHK